MDAAALTELVHRILEQHPTKLSFSAAAASVLETMQSFPDGVTDVILLCMLPGKAQRSRRSPIDVIYEDRHINLYDVHDFIVRRAHTDLMLEVEDGEGDQVLLCKPGGRLARPPAAVAAQLADLAGRRVRLTRTNVTETAVACDGQKLLLLPTPYTALVLDAARDAPLLRAAPRRVRGHPMPPPDESGASLLRHALLRVARATPLEHPYAPSNDKALRRLLLVADDGAAPHAADEPCEIEAELLLWDEEGALLALLPPGARLLLVDVCLHTSGEPARGGAPAQLGLHGETTLVCLVPEDGEESAAATAAAAGMAAPPARPPTADADGLGPPLPPLSRRAATRAAAHAAKRTVGGAADGAPAAAPNGPKAPIPETDEAAEEEPASAVLGRMLAWPAPLAQGGLALRVHDGAHELRVELHGDGDGDVHRLRHALRPGNHVFIHNVHARPTSPAEALPAPAAALDIEDIAAHPLLGAPPPPPQPPPQQQQPGLQPSAHGFDELSDEVLMAMDLDFPMPPEAGAPAVPPSPVPPPPTALWTGVLDGVEPARVHNLSTLHSAMCSHALRDSARVVGLGTLSCGAATSALTLATLSTLERMPSAAPNVLGWRVVLTDGSGALLPCELVSGVLEELVDAGVDDFERMSPEEQAQRVRSADCHASTARLWALTRAPPECGGGWCANAVAWPVIEAGSDGDADGSS